MSNRKNGDAVDAALGYAGSLSAQEVLAARGRYLASITSGTPVTYAGDGTKKTFATYTIPKGSVIPGMHGKLKTLWMKTGTVGGNTVGIYLNGVAVFEAWPSATYMRYSTDTDFYISPSGQSFFVLTPAQTQVLYTGDLRYSTTVASGEYSVDFTNDVILTIKGIAQVGENQTLQSFALEF